MATDRERLIFLLDDALSVYRFDAWENSDRIASHLMSHGVTMQKHGRWEYEGFLVTKCSACKKVLREMGGGNFCPNCGADMRGEEDV